jgi:hypothetical protein
MDKPESLALISGLVGALISAALSYFVRLALDHRTLRIAERRLAYVYLVRVSEVVAMDQTCRIVVNVLMPSGAAEKLKSATGSFGPSHKVSAMLADMMRAAPLDKLREDATYRAIPRFVKAQIESAKEVKLSAEQLAKLPKEVVYESNRFLAHHAHVMQVLEMWGAFFEHGEDGWISAEGIHDQWLALVRYIESAKRLRGGLVAAGAATPSEASELVKRQLSQMLGLAVQKWQDQPKLAAAAADLKPAT